MIDDEIMKKLKLSIAKKKVIFDENKKFFIEDSNIILNSIEVYAINNSGKEIPLLHPLYHFMKSNENKYQVVIRNRRKDIKYVVYYDVVIEHKVEF